MKNWIYYGMLLMSTSGWAGAVPSQITYQGTLKQAGAAANGAYTMTFRLTDSAGLHQYWSSGPQSITVSQGLFSSVLSPVGVDWQNVSPFIEVNVNGQVLLPREAVTATAYALMCGSLADGSVLAGMIAMFSGQCPAGWTLFAPLEGRFPAGADPNNPAQFVLGHRGGDLTHAHAISQDGTHDHGGTTGPPNGEQASDAGSNFSSPIGNHVHSIAMDGAHDHGGTTGVNSSSSSLCGAYILPEALKLSFIILSGICLCRAADASSELSEGATAFQEHRWRDAMGTFLHILDRDPQNPQAHTYLTLMAQEVQSRRHTAVQEGRLQVLAQASRRLDNAHLDPRALDAAILDTTQAEERTRQERWRAWCEQAEVEMQMNHLLASNDLVFRVLSENPNDGPAQQQLSELQIRLRSVLDAKVPVPSEEFYARQGFYAYGQADYESATVAWEKSLTLIQQTYPAPIAMQHVAALRFGPYLQSSQAHVDESRRISETHSLFRQATDFYEKGRYSEALETFRKVAVLNPNYAQLGEQLARTEAAIQQERTLRLGEARQQQVARLMDASLKALEQAHYGEAERGFQQALAVDTANSQAQFYLAMVQAEIRRRHDPQAAQQHYEAGLVAYAGGKLEDAIREWTIATRMNAHHDKALNALAKVQKELTLSREFP